MKSVLCTIALSLGLGLAPAYAEEINPRALDDANTHKGQEKKASTDGKQKAVENATDQQADPNIKRHHNDQRSDQPRSGQERR
ncbi:hypothetical protein LG198_12155 [Methylobacillus arboreus]|uniref:hypothetical protein n=1 Tax=Methylobacillus arboreus TaxID=755170 RepID=UPI001E4EA047|nr:hypothetical protein [Methylobacillus arboreus]MCB5191482.1 hypothetical protein [Methylobacillus arboreus]